MNFAAEKAGKVAVYLKSSLTRIFRLKAGLIGVGNNRQLNNIKKSLARKRIANETTGIKNQKVLK